VRVDTPNDPAALVRRYTGFQLSFALLFWLPVFYEYQRHVGLTDEQIFGIQSLYYIAFCILEIPTGYAADRLGYRTCMRAGSVFLVAANLLPIFNPSYGGFLAHFVLVALARSFVSGAASAYLYDALMARGEQATYKDVEGRARAYGLVAKVVGWAGVGALMKWKVTAPYWLSVGSAVLAVGFALSLPAAGREADPEAAEEEPPSMLRGVEMVFQTPALALAVTQGIAVFVLARVVQAGLFQPILGGKGLPLETYGLVMAMMTAFEAVGSGRSKWVHRVLADGAAVLVFTTLLALAMAGIPLANAAGTVALLAVLAYCAGVVFPLQRQLVNDAVPDSRYRATVLSVESIVDRAAHAFVAKRIAVAMEGGDLDGFLHRAAAVTGGMMVLLYGVRSLRTRRGGGTAEPTSVRPTPGSPDSEA
jgi:MFS family permease